MTAATEKATRREAMLKARWSEPMLRQFERAAAERGRTAAEVLRELAAGYIDQRAGALGGIPQAQV
jgi:hypothetical protein